MTCTKTVTRPSHRPNLRTQEWYDRSLRLWTVIAVDIEGNQIGGAQYCPRRDGLKLARLDAVTQKAADAYKGSEVEHDQISRAFGFLRTP